MKKALIILLAAALLLACAGCGAGGGTSKNQTSSPALVKSVTLYGVDYETKEWTEWLRTDYAYDDNGYPATVTEVWPDGETTTVTVFSYVFENGAPVSMSCETDGVPDHTAEYVNGNLSRTSECFEDGQSTRHLIYMYGNGDGYFTSVLHSSHVGAGPYAPDDPCYNAEEYDAVKVTTENGLLRKTVNTGLYSNWMDGEDREWMRFNGTYTAEYDDEGVLTDTSSTFRDGQTGIDYVFEVTRADGKVTEVIRKTKIDGEITDDAKIVFEYCDTPIDTARYSLMINAHIMEQGNNYYIYNWY